MVSLPMPIVADAYLDGGGVLNADGVVAIQQHTTYTDIVASEKRDAVVLKPFGVVVANVQKCLRERRSFDAAVLWFNDRFLFGDKNVTESGPTCTVPEGFLVATLAKDAFGALEDPGDVDPCAASVGFTVQARNLAQCLPALLLSDNQCEGCLFNHTSAFYVTDPNGPPEDQQAGLGAALSAVRKGNNWIVDKFTITTLVPVEDEDVPDTLDLPTIEDGGPPPGAIGDERGADDIHVTENGTFVSIAHPVYITHLQREDVRNALSDVAPWQPLAGDTPRNGTPRFEGWGTGVCLHDAGDPQCTIQYSALIAVDFAAFDQIGRLLGGGSAIRSHGPGGANSDDEAKEGNSHAHHGEGVDDDFSHDHKSVKLDLFFVECPVQLRCTGDPSNTAAVPFELNRFVKRYWLDGSINVTGAEPAITMAPPRLLGADVDECVERLPDDAVICADTCYEIDTSHGSHNVTLDGEGPQNGTSLASSVFSLRNFDFCDISADTDSFHAHDGSMP